MAKELISNKEIDQKLIDEGINKEEFFKNVEAGIIKPLVYHPNLKKLMPFRVTKHHKDGTIDGYFIDDMN